MKHGVCADDEIGPSEARAVRVDGIAVVVIRKPDGTLSAPCGTCVPTMPHVMSLGAVRPLTVSTPENPYAFLGTEFTIAVRGHGFEFDTETGRCPADPDNFRARAYPVTVENRRILVER